MITMNYPIGTVGGQDNN